MPPEALCFDSEHSHAWKELYEVPGGRSSHACKEYILSDCHRRHVQRRQSASPEEAPSAREHLRQ
eukprot:231929-Pyramimonas_sp.AAC.1